MRFINIGFGNRVALSRVIAVVSPESAPIKRIIQDAKDAGRAVDVTCGKRTRSVILTDGDYVIMSAFQTETLSNRMMDDSDRDDDDPMDEDDGEDE